MAQFSLKPIDPDAIPRALEKAERYRLLEEPEEAESICLDIVAIDPDHQQALITLLLSLSDQFETDCGECYLRAKDVLPRIHGEYEKHYYAGIICERRGHALLDKAMPGSGGSVYNWLHEAMECYEKAEALRPPGNDDAILRWNTCARIIMKHGLTAPVDTLEPLALE